MKKKHLRVIQMIQEKIPKDLLINLMKEEIESPTLRKLVELALTKPDSEVPARKKKHLQALLDSGRLDRKVMVLDHDIEKQIDDFLQEEIALAVKLGRLPKVAPKMKLLKNKGKQYARKQEARLRKEFMGKSDVSDDDMESSSQDQAEHKTRAVDDGLLRTPGI